MADATRPDRMVLITPQALDALVAGAERTQRRVARYVAALLVLAAVSMATSALGYYMLGRMILLALEVTAFSMSASMFGRMMRQGATESRVERAIRGSSVILILLAFTNMMAGNGAYLFGWDDLGMILTSLGGLFAIAAVMAGMARRW